MKEEKSQNRQDSSDPKPVAVEGKLPLKAVGIENLREANPGHLPPHRYLHPWFARRPTPVSRLAVLASVLPQDVDTNDLLRWMQIGPNKNIETSIASYVETKKATEDDRDGDLTEHYDYPRPFTSSPSKPEIQELHDVLTDFWDDDLPTVLDPMAGGGVIPFESLRYNLPTKANELNSVPSVILKVLLEFVPSAGEIEPEVNEWATKINNRVQAKTSDLFPTVDGETPENYITTHIIECETCGAQIPLVRDWKIRTSSKAKVYAKPKLDDGELSYECAVDPDSPFLDGFDPSDGPLSRGGDTECISCGVVMESEAVKQRLNDDNFNYQVYCLRAESSKGEKVYRAPNQKDQKALEKASERVQSEFELSTLLSTEIPPGEKTREIRRYGPEEWQDVFNPRQLVVHYEYLKAFKQIEPQVRQKYDTTKANAILTLLTLACSKSVERNSRLTAWDSNWGFPSSIFKGNDFAFKYSFVDNNLSVGAAGFLKQIEWIVDSYEELRSYLPEDTIPGEVTNTDAAELPYAENSIDTVVIDPPYYTSIMYGELSDIFYVWMREYLGETYPDLFSSKLTDKENEAVANPSRFEGVTGNGSSKKGLADEYYEQKMSDIFSELYRVLERGGVMTVMFTHKETDAWDTLAMSLINSGFTITSTHPVTSEMPTRASMKDRASADSTLLLTGRKPTQEKETKDKQPSLWNDVKSDTRKTAKEAARDLLDSGLSLTKTDVIISAFGPTLRVFADAYPVVDDEDNEVPPRKALEEAREAVTQILVEEFLDSEGINHLDDITEWYILCWLVHESQIFSFDEGHQLGLGLGVNIDEIKRSTKTWRKSSGDIKLRGHADRVQNVNENPENRSNRFPVNPDDLSFRLTLDAVHAAMHVYDTQGDTACSDWLRERNFDSDTSFKSTLKALLQVLPHEHEDWELARDLAVGKTRNTLGLDFDPSIFSDTEQKQAHLDSYN